jgi:hypothetical protein
MLVFMLTLPSLVRPGTDTCTRNGFQSTADDKFGQSGWSDVDQAYVAVTGSSIVSYEYYLGLKGSYITGETGSYTFRLKHGSNKPSTSRSNIQFYA